MEKSGRFDSANCRSRLLNKVSGIALLCLFFTFPLKALEVDTFVSSFEISTGDSLVIAFTIRDADPAVTFLTEPSVPPSFAPLSSRKERTQIKTTGLFANDHASATVITREWAASSSGSFSLGPFTITSGEESVTLSAINITVTAVLVQKKAVLRWVTDGTQSKIGMPLRIVLEGFFTGSAGRISCAAPENALLETVSGGKESASESGWTVLASYDWIPLVQGSQELPLAILEVTIDSGAVEKIVSESKTLAVAWAPPPDASESIPKTLGKAFSAPPASVSGTKERDDAVFPVLPPSLQTDPELTAVLDFKAHPWMSGNYALILKALREAEYTSFFPSKYRTVRLAVEECLDLGETLSVPPAAWKSLSLIVSVCLLSAAFILKLISFRRRLSPNFVYLSVFISVLLAILSIWIYTRDLLPSGVVTGGDLLHVPESNSTVIAPLKEGSTVHILRRTGNWVYVETSEALQGWLTAGQVLQYSKTE